VSHGPVLAPHLSSSRPCFILGDYYYQGGGEFDGFDGGLVCFCCRSRVI
jgi:hypothetical protein